MIPVPSKYRQNEYVHFMVEICNLLTPRVYCELGIRKCYTINTIANFCELAIGVDTNEEAGKSICGSNIQFFNMKTSDFAVTYGGPKIDLLFIDADHSAVAVMNDVAMMTQHLKPFTSLVLMHDTHPVKEELITPGYCGDAWRAAKYMHQNNEDWEVVTLPGPWAGLTIMRYCPDNCHGWMDK